MDLKEEYGLTELEIQKVDALFDLLGGDLDGIWSMLGDEEIYIDFEDLLKYEELRGK